MSHATNSAYEKAILQWKMDIHFRSTTFTEVTHFMYSCGSVAEEEAAAHLVAEEVAAALREEVAVDLDMVHLVNACRLTKRPARNTCSNAKQRFRSTGMMP